MLLCNSEVNAAHLLTRTHRLDHFTCDGRRATKCEKKAFMLSEHLYHPQYRVCVHVRMCVGVIHGLSKGR